MSIADKYNKTKVFNFTIPSEYQYHSLSDLFEKNGKNKTYPVKALYINKKSRYGDAPIVATDECLVNLPSHLLDTVKEMINDDELVDAVNAGKFGFTIYTYENKQRKELCFSVNWVDM